MLLKSCVAVLITDVGKLEFHLFPVSIICKTMCIQINWYSHVHLCSVMKLNGLGTGHGSCFVFPIQGSSMSNMHLSADTIIWSV